MQDISTILVCGPPECGKTKLCERLACGRYTGSYTPTLEERHRIKLKGMKTILFLDTGGDADQFNSMFSGWLAESTAVFVLYSVGSTSSFETCRDIVITKLAQQSTKKTFVPFAIIGTKDDDEVERVVPKSQGVSLANAFLCPFFECSALEQSGDELREIFSSIIAVFLSSSRDRRRLPPQYAVLQKLFTESLRCSLLLFSGTLRDYVEDDLTPPALQRRGSNLHVSEREDKLRSHSPRGSSMIRVYSEPHDADEIDVKGSGKLFRRLSKSSVPKPSKHVPYWTVAIERRHTAFSVCEKICGKLQKPAHSLVLYEVASKGVSGPKERELAAEETVSDAMMLWPFLNAYRLVVREKDEILTKDNVVNPHLISFGATSTSGACRRKSLYASAMSILRTRLRQIAFPHCTARVQHDLGRPDSFLAETQTRLDELNERLRKATSKSSVMKALASSSVCSEADELVRDILAVSRKWIESVLGARIDGDQVAVSSTQPYGQSPLPSRATSSIASSVSPEPFNPIADAAARQYGTIDFPMDGYTAPQNYDMANLAVYGSGLGTASPLVLSPAGSPKASPSSSPRLLPARTQPILSPREEATYGVLQLAPREEAENAAAETYSAMPGPPASLEGREDYGTMPVIAPPKKPPMPKGSAAPAYNDIPAAPERKWSEASFTEDALIEARKRAASSGRPEIFIDPTVSSPAIEARKWREKISPRLPRTGLAAEKNEK